MAAKPHNLNKAPELGEGQFIEFKESFDKSLAKEIAAFVNASGGVIYLGVNDDDRVDILDKKEVDRGIIGNIEFAEDYLKERVVVS